MGGRKAFLGSSSFSLVSFTHWFLASIEQELNLGLNSATHVNDTCASVVKDVFRQKAQRYLRQDAVPA